MSTTRHKRPNPQSTKRQAEAKVYRARKKVFLENTPTCFACGELVHPADRELHHKRGRAGNLYLDERFWEMACGGVNGCHAKIHRDRKWAIQNGFLGGPGEWGVCPPLDDYAKECTPELAQKLKARIAEKLNAQ